MQAWFRYNWIVREQWYEWCGELSLDELLQVRTGGAGGILKTLFHIVDVEWSWLQTLQGKPDFEEDFRNYATLARVRELDRRFRADIEGFIGDWDDSMERKPLHNALPDGRVRLLSWGEVMRHVVAHEIHHIGQLSVWSRELGRKPVSANFIEKGLIAPAAP
ncbi:MULTISPECIES: DinB family protein [unclassified Paenibacillus]|uniref:DinB family protein n=1 Tax=unclassified Paenibacillus TaxID=185978 RepID=UPI0009565EEB|nr:MULTISPECIES: DinB family protein [unclassified Paenibacillus]ASS68447.1 damage-inducible protein DinB [Paenibacillus sp. RUD330]SIR33868.1 Uncharacterized damage-inducible protein DinB (forms a four-helix bundle) [Paenibacillus sp. RU4X]SIR44717.1 Uncharacterized damage-inducible protein DinB (forms a four-helix bundle) [Paenibacillus sp. RU4T]